MNAVDGTVYLRGEVERPSDVDEIERRVREIAGVERVEQLLHLPGTPAKHA